MTSASILALRTTSHLPIFSKIQKKSPQRRVPMRAKRLWTRRSSHAHEGTHDPKVQVDAELLHIQIKGKTRFITENSAFFNAKIFAKPSHARKKQTPARSAPANSAQLQSPNCAWPRRPPPPRPWCAWRSKSRFSPACVNYGYKIIGSQSFRPPCIIVTEWHEWNQNWINGGFLSCETGSFIICVESIIKQN